MENPTSALLHDFIFYLLKTEGIYKQCLCMPVFFYKGVCVAIFTIFTVTD